MQALRIGSGLASGALFAFVAACGGGDSGGGGGAGPVDGGAATGGGGTTGTGATGSGATAGGGTGGTVAVDCTNAGDCSANMPATTPADCATAECDTVLGKCVFKAKDQDGDGHAAAKCVPTGGGIVETGDDCDDTDATTYPGAWDGPADGSYPDRCDTKDQDCDGNTDDEKTSGGKSCACDPNNLPKCAETAQGAPIPGLDSSKDGVGICKLGLRECLNGVPGACSGASGPAEKNCASSVDNDCNGTNDKNEVSVCKCQSGQSQACQTGQSGECAAGTQQCTFSGSASSWGTCTPNTTPAPSPNCSSSKDYNCNTKADNTESGCKCDGTVNVGQSASCNTHPGYDGKGECKAGSRKCQLNGTIVQWSSCTGDVAPAPDDGCEPLKDLSCDGLYGDGAASCFVTVHTLVPPGQASNFNLGLPVTDAMWSTSSTEGGWESVGSVKMYKTNCTGCVPATRCYDGTIAKHRSVFSASCPSGSTFEKTFGYVLQGSQPAGFLKYGYRQWVEIRAYLPSTSSVCVVYGCNFTSNVFVPD